LNCIDSTTLFANEIDKRTFCELDFNSSFVSGLIAVVASYFAGTEQNQQAERIEKLSTKTMN